MSSEIKSRVMVGEIVGDLHRIVDSAMQRSIVACPNCEHWKAFNETCGLYNQRPPAPVIAFGCNSFLLNEIPF
jgi:hypothetical protein